MFDLQYAKAAAQWSATRFGKVCCVYWSPWSAMYDIKGNTITDLSRYAEDDDPFFIGSPVKIALLLERSLVDKITVAACYGPDGEVIFEEKCNG